jgi:hypothetical protein
MFMPGSDTQFLDLLYEPWERIIPTPGKKMLIADGKQGK